MRKADIGCFDDGGEQNGAALSVCMAENQLTFVAGMGIYSSRSGGHQELCRAGSLCCVPLSALCRGLRLRPYSRPIRMPSPHLGQELGVAEQSSAAQRGCSIAAVLLPSAGRWLPINVSGCLLVRAHKGACDDLYPGRLFVITNL